MALSQKDFLTKYNISVEDFTKANIEYENLIEIQNDYIYKFPKFDDAGANLVRILLRFEGVHSVKYRIKDPEHLIEKIIRKRCKNPDIEINISNYQDNVQDLIGIRILHLFKSDWLLIHNQLKLNFKQIEKPEANIRKGDIDTLFKANGCKIKIHPAGYRSVHYLIVTEPTLKPYTSEVQVRTIFEEAWSEIDHKVRYPYFTDNDMINQFLKIFNRLAGSADEMGEFVTTLKTELLLNQKLLAERQQEIENLKGQINTSTLDAKTKEDLSGGLDSLKLHDFYARYESPLDHALKIIEYSNPTFDLYNKISEYSKLLNKRNLSETVLDSMKRLNDTPNFQGLQNEVTYIHSSTPDATKDTPKTKGLIEPNDTSNKDIAENKKETKNELPQVRKKTVSKTKRNSTKT